MHVLLDTAAAMEKFGAQLGQHCPAGSKLYLQGELGAGKTTLVRGFLRARAYQGTVKSPTYTLVEPYEFAHTKVFHFDLYRLRDADELENIGFRDYFDGAGICLVEWPEKAAALLQTPDLSININILAQGRSLDVLAHTSSGKDLLSLIQ
jgi:tRNA threonylcarbamoyladenosine biosynthesis protein TsaE